MMWTRFALTLSASIGLLPFLARGDNWPQFRGPDGGCVSANAKLPVQWGPDHKVRWKVKISGEGWSSPIVWEDKIFVTTVVKPQSKVEAGGDVYRWEVHCLDRTSGKTLWKQCAIEGKPPIPKYKTNTYASETPVTDGQRLYAYFGMVGLFCYDYSGELLWKKDFGAYRMGWNLGTGSSPVLDGDSLFVQCDNEEKSFLVALDRKNGEERWRAARDEQSSWATPYVWRNHKRTELVAAGNRKYRSYDPATGKVLWELGGQSVFPRASPVGDAEALYLGTVGNGQPGALFAVRAGASGDLTLKNGATSNEGVIWSRPKDGPSLASPLLYKGYLYILSQDTRGISCYDARTGTPAYYRERIQGARDGFTATPWAGSDRVFCLDNTGQAFVIQSGPEFKLLSKSSLNDTFWASPAVSGGELFLRGVDHLYCVGQ